MLNNQHSFRAWKTRACASDFSRSARQQSTVQCSRVTLSVNTFVFCVVLQENCLSNGLRDFGSCFMQVKYHLSSLQRTAWLLCQSSTPSYYFYKSHAMLPKIRRRSCELVRCHPVYDPMLFRIMLFFIQTMLHVMKERNVLTTDSICPVCWLLLMNYWLNRGGSIVVI